MGNEATRSKRSPRPRLSPSHHELAINVLLACGIIAAVLLLVLLLWQAVQVLLLMFFGILLAILIRAAADPLIRYLRFPDPLAVVTVLIFATGALSLTVWWLAPYIIVQIEEMQRRIPESIAELATRLRSTVIGQWLIAEEVAADPLRDQWSQMLLRATGLLYTTAGIVMAAIIVLFVAIYAAATPSLYTKGVLRLAPKAYRPRLQDVIAGVGYTLRWWLVGQLVAMTAVGLMTGIGLWLLEVPLPVTLALLAFSLEFIPNFGPIAAAIPAVLLSLADDPTKAVYVALLYLVVQQIQSFLITPLVQRGAVRLPPVLTIMGQLLMWLLGGILGLLLATPLTATAMVLTRMLYVEDILGDEVHTPDTEVGEEQRPELPDAEDTSLGDSSGGGDDDAPEHRDRTP